MNDARGDQLTLGILGLGHVGLPTAQAFVQLGWQVVGADDDQDKARLIASGESPFFEPGLREALRRSLSSGRFRVAEDVPAAIREATVLFVCVGTPQMKDGSADLSQVERLARTIAEHLNGYKLVVEKSTTPVRTAEQLKRAIARYASGEHEFDVAVNPEFLREGTALDDSLNPDRIVLGVESDRARDLLLRVYAPLLERGGERETLGGHRRTQAVVCDLSTAELIKHAANSYLATKISFINMVADVCEATGADVAEVARGIGLDPRIGSHFLQAGIGFGGACFPKDVRAFRRIGADHGVDMGLLNDVERINLARPGRLVDKLRKCLWVLRGKTVAVWGLAFKPGTDDVREAPSLRVVATLLEEGARLRLYDPQAAGEFQRTLGRAAEDVTYCESPQEAVEGADALVVLTEWPEFAAVDLRAVKSAMAVPIIVDGRNCLDRHKAIELGFEFHGIGR